MSSSRARQSTKTDIRTASRNCCTGSLSRYGLRLAAGTTFAVAAYGNGSAQSPTPDPASWRPWSYADLQRPASATRTYADIWKDAIDRNNRAYVDRGDRRFEDTNAPVTEAHFVIWSPKKSVVLSVLDTATSCTLKEIHASARATIRMCPMRLAIYEGIVVHTLDGGRACYLERSAASRGAAPDADVAAAYASYDPATRTIHTGLVVDHRPVEGCSQAIPLPPP